MNLLLATDGSDFSGAATQAVVAQIKRKGTEVRVMHVVDTMTEPFPEMTTFDAEVMHAPNPQRRPAEALVQGTAKQLRTEGFNATTVVDWGDPRSKIIEVAKTWPADLIVLGSHGRTGLQYLLVGSVSDGVAHHAPCSVQIVRTHNKNQRTSKTLKILLAVDDSKFSEAAEEAVFTQMKPNGTEVKLLCVLEPFPVAEAEKMGTTEYPDFAGARVKLRDQAKQKLSKTVAKFQSVGFKASQTVEEGDPREMILDYADRWGVDLIVVGSHGRTGIKRFLMGSVSEAVNRYAGCSVEIVRLQSNQ